MLLRICSSRMSLRCTRVVGAAMQRSIPRIRSLVFFQAVSVSGASEGRCPIERLGSCTES
eukprot:9950686-Alexandrium_andersonii.AAC.1